MYVMMGAIYVYAMGNEFIEGIANMLVVFFLSFNFTNQIFIGYEQWCNCQKFFCHSKAHTEKKNTLPVGSSSILSLLAREALKIHSLPCIWHWIYSVFGVCIFHYYCDNKRIRNGIESHRIALNWIEFIEWFEFTWQYHIRVDEHWNGLWWQLYFMWMSLSKLLVKT